MSHKKKQIERIHLEKFISNKTFNETIFKIKETERPDFIVKLNNRIVSIEHTRLLNPDTQEVEQYKDKIIKAAQKIFENKYREKLYVLITFHEIRLQGGRNNEEEYINHVFEIVERVYLNNKDFEFHVSSKLNSPGVSDLIERIDINNSLNFSHWQHFGAYIVESIDHKWFTNVIQKKEKDIIHYDEKVDEHWLLLVSDFGTKASTKCFYGFDFSKINTKFDRIYLYSFMPDSITIVK